MKRQANTCNACTTLKHTTLKQNLSDLISPSELSEMELQERVLVDSSAICAILHSNIELRRQRKAMSVRKIEARIFDSSAESERIVFGEEVELSICDVRDVFGDVENVPLGVLKRIRTEH